MDEKSKVRILFVEEDERARISVCARLAFEGYQADSASTISEGVRLAEKQKYDLILVDWYYDDGTGIQLCEMIRSFDAETPILFYTAVASEAKLEKAKEAGAQGLINKPIDDDELKQAVERYAKKEKSASGS